MLLENPFFEVLGEVKEESDFGALETPLKTSMELEDSPCSNPAQGSATLRSEPLLRG